MAALVSRGGRLDFMDDELRMLTAPTLLLVGGRDPLLLEVNEWAARLLGPTSHIHAVPGAGHLFEEPGALQMVAAMAIDWFTSHFSRTAARAA